MRRTIDWSAWNHHHKMASLCRGEEKTLTDQEVDEFNRLVGEINQRIDALNAIAGQGIERFKTR